MSLSSARIVPLPTAAPKPVKQSRRRGSLPSGVASFCAAFQERAECLKQLDFLEEGVRTFEATARRMRDEAEELRQKAGIARHGVQA